LEPYDIVELVEDLPVEGLRAGEVGTIVDVYTEPPAFEVEFTDGEGVTVALLALRPEQLRPTAHDDYRRAGEAIKDD
jgi:Domain of unknown function (DUF4926)